MSEVVKHKIFYILVWHIILLTINIFANTVIYLKSKKTKLLYSFLYMQAAIMIWLLAKILKTVSYNTDLRWFFIVFQYFGICLLEVTFLEFSHIYAFSKPIKKRIKIVLYTIACLQFLVVITNPFHYLFYSRYEFSGDDFGILFYVHMTIQYITTFFGFYFCLKKLKEAYNNMCKYITILGAIIFPLVFNIIYLLRISKKIFRLLGVRFSFDITPIAFSISILLFIYAIFKQELLDVLPIVKDDIVSHIGSIVLITDANNNLIDFNEKATEVFSISECDIKRNIDFLELDKKIIYIEDIKHDAVFIKNHGYFSISKLEIEKKLLGHIGYIIVFYNITNYMELRNQLNKKTEELDYSNRKLRKKIDMKIEASKIRVESFVAGELHDILGHSLTIIIKLLEMAKISCKKDKDLSISTLNEAVGLLGFNYRDLNTSLSVNKANNDNLASLKYDLIETIGFFEKIGLSIDFNMTDSKKVINHKQYKTIKRIVQEALTNSIKHGKADNAYITIVFSMEKFQIYIVDNGGGTGDIVFGNGLSGMKNRVSELGGKMAINSDEGSGFVLYFEF